MNQVRTLDVGQVQTKIMDLNLVSWDLLSSVPSWVWLMLKIGVFISWMGTSGESQGSKLDRGVRKGQWGGGDPRKRQHLPIPYHYQEITVISGSKLDYRKTLPFSPLWSNNSQDTHVYMLWKHHCLRLVLYVCVFPLCYITDHFGNLDFQKLKMFRN